MPHADNSNWMSQIAGKPVEAPRRETIQDLIDSRPFFEAMADLSDLPEMAEVHEEVVLRERGGARLTAEVYVPKGAGPFPPYLHVHGGGWCVGSARNDRKLGMRFAEQGFVVVNVEYGLAPEHPFPRALEDCLYAARWAVAHAADFNADGSKLAIGGGSAGANLAAATILALNGLGGGLDQGDLAGVPVTFSAAVLFYGIFSFPLMMDEPGSNFGSIELWNQAYLGPQFLRQHRNPLASPVFAPNLGAFPPTYLSCGAEDSFLGHSLEMTKALAQASVPTTLSVIAGADHGMAKMERVLPVAAEELERAFAWLRRATDDRRPTTPAPSSIR